MNHLTFMCLFCLFLQLMCFSYLCAFVSQITHIIFFIVVLSKRYVLSQMFSIVRGQTLLQMTASLQVEKYIWTGRGEVCNFVCFQKAAHVLKLQLTLHLSRERFVIWHQDVERYDFKMLNNVSLNQTLHIVLSVALSEAILRLCSVHKHFGFTICQWVCRAGEQKEPQS